MTVFGHNSNVIRTPEEFHEAIKNGYKVSLDHVVSDVSCVWGVDVCLSSAHTHALTLIRTKV